MKIPSNHKILNKIVATLLAGVVLVAYILLTNPNNVALPLLLLPFIVTGFILYEVTSIVVCLFNASEQSVFVKLLPISIGFIGVTLLVLSSLHQLTWRDTLLVVLFTGLFWVYIWRADFLRKKS